MDNYCKVCKELVPIELAMEVIHGREEVWTHCPACGSDNIIRVDDQFDAAEYAKGNKL